MRFIRKLCISIALVVTIPILGAVVVITVARQAQKLLPDDTRWPVFGSRPAGWAAASGPEYEEVWFGRTLYRLPVRKYRIWVQQYDAKRDHAAFGFDALVPDATPMADDPAEVAVWGKGKGWHRNLHVLVEYGTNFISQAQMFENAFEHSSRMKHEVDEMERETGRKNRSNIIFMDRSKYTTLQNGCRRYDGYFTGGSVLQACGEGDNLLIISCNTGIPGVELKPPSPVCVVHFNFSDKTELTYSYGYDYFDSAPNIHKNVVSLLNSFRVDARSEGRSGGGGEGI